MPEQRSGKIALVTGASPRHREGDRGRARERRLRRRDPRPHRARRRGTRAQLHAAAIRHLTAAGIARRHRRARSEPPGVNASVCKPTCSTTRHSCTRPATVLAEWGHVDVLVNNGRYIGPGHMDHILDTPVRILRDHLEANALAPVALIKEVVPQMIERGGGTVINITSTVAYEDPDQPAGGRLGPRLRVQQRRAASHRGHPRGRATREQRARLQRAARLHRHRTDATRHGRVRLRCIHGRAGCSRRQGLPVAVGVARRRRVQRAEHPRPAVLQRARAPPGVDARRAT